MSKLVCMLSLLLAAALLPAADKPIACSLSVAPIRGESRMKKPEKKGNASGGSTTVTRNMKWLAKIGFRDGKPEKAELKVHFLGVTDGAADIEELEEKSYPVEFDEKGKVKPIEVESRMYSQTKTKSRQSGNSNRGGSKSTVKGSKVTGCVMQVFVGETMVKGWASDGRWSKAAIKGEFKVDDLATK